MSTKTFDEILQAFDRARVANDAATVLQCAEDFVACGTPDADAYAVFARGSWCFVRGEYTAALDHYGRALAMFEESGDRTHVAAVTGNIGNVHHRSGDNTVALEYMHRAVAIYGELGNTSGMARVNNNLGLVYASTGNLAAALEYYHRALALLEELGDNSGAAAIINNIGTMHESTGNYPEALQHFYRALTLHEKLGERSGVARATGNIGNVLQKTGTMSAALEHYHRALAMHGELGENSSVALVTGNIGSVYYSTGNYTDALDHFQRALALHEELGERSGVARDISNTVSTMVRSGDLANAASMLQTMDALQIDDPAIRVSREVHRASLQEQRGDVDAAWTTLQAALSIALERSLAPKQAEVHKALRDLALKRNDLAGYVEHNNEFTRITEEINGKDTATKLAMQEKQREIDARERELAKHLAVLHSTLPREVADRVARGETVNDHFENASVIFLDIVGFTTLSSSMSSQEVIALLDDIFTQCDAICAKHGVTKIKTIGDSYMAVSFDSVINAALCAVEMSRIQYTIQNTEFNPSILQYRIGIHCGPVTAGVIGKERMQYDVWGDTVNVASRMESSSEAGRVHVSETFANNLKINQESRIKNPTSESHEVPLVTRHLKLVTTPRGLIDIKGKGPMQTYWLE